MKNFVPKIGKGKAQEVTRYFQFGGGVLLLEENIQFLQTVNKLFPYFNNER